MDARDARAVATERRRAKAFWAQRRASLSLRFDARDAREIEIEVEDADSVAAGRSIVRVSYVARLGDEARTRGGGVGERRERGVRVRARAVRRGRARAHGGDQANRARVYRGIS